MTEQQSSSMFEQKARADTLNGPTPFFPTQSTRRRPPNAEEMMDYYSKKGLDKQAATEKVIDDLQKALTIAVGRYPRKAQEMETSIRSASANIDSLSRRMSALEARLDEKPDFFGVFAAGVAAGGLLQAAPLLFRASCEIGRKLKQATASNP